MHLNSPATSHAIAVPGNAANRALSQHDRAEARGPGAGAAAADAGVQQIAPPLVRVAGNEAAHHPQDLMPIPIHHWQVTTFDAVLLRAADAGEASSRRRTPPGLSAGAPMTKPDDADLDTSPADPAANLVRQDIQAESGPRPNAPAGRDRSGVLERATFVEVVRSAQGNLGLLDAMLVQQCTHHSAFTLVLDDFAPAERMAVLHCLLRHEHWSSMSIDIGVRHAGWERCLPVLHDFMSRTQAKAGRSVRLDFGVGSVATASAPAILHQQRRFLHGFTELTFHGMDLHGATGEALRTTLADDTSVLRKLTLSRAYLGNCEVEQFAHALHANTTLSVFYLACFPIGPRALSALCGMLAVNRGIAELALVAIRPDKAGMQLLLKSLAGKEGLRTLDLSGNNIDEELIVELAAWMGGKHCPFGPDRRQTSLECLSLTNMRCFGNDFDESYRDYAALIEWFGGAQQANPWTLTACAALADMLAQNRHLQRLDLNDNPISPEGLSVLLDGLRANESIVEMRCNRTKLDFATTQQLQGLMRERDRGLRLELNLYASSTRAVTRADELMAQFPLLEIVWWRDPHAVPQGFDARRHETVTLPVRSV